MAASASLACAGIAFTAFSFYKSHQRSRAAKRDSLAKLGVSTGKFEYHFTEKNLIIKGPSGARKFAWPLFLKLAQTKKNILFMRDDGEYEFLPKNVLREGVTFESIASKFEPRLNQRLLFDEAQHVKPLVVTFECFDEDYEEFRLFRDLRHDGIVAPLRRLSRWRPAPVIQVHTFATIGVICLVLGIRDVNLWVGAMGAFSFLAAFATFIVNPHAFSNRKARQSTTTLTSITMTKDAVFRQARGETEAYQWAAIDEVVELKSTIYLVVSDFNILPIPRRSFLDAHHARDFCAFAKSHVARAKRIREEAYQNRLARTITKKGAQKPDAKAPQKKLPPANKPRALPAPDKPAPVKKRAAAPAKAQPVVKKTPAAKKLPPAATNGRTPASPSAPKAAPAKAPTQEPSIRQKLAATSRRR